MTANASRRRWNTGGVIVGVVPYGSVALYAVMVSGDGRPPPTDPADITKGIVRGFIPVLLQEEAKGHEATAVHLGSPPFEQVARVVRTKVFTRVTKPK